MSVSAPGSRTDVAVVILTLNEEPNLPGALDSVAGWAREVFVLDSFSSDRTVEIARKRGAHVAQNRFVDYGSQRNHALTALPITSEWVFFLDADERMTPELREEVSRLVASNPRENGFYVKFRLIWMGMWVKRGYYPTWILRLFRHGRARCEARSVNEHLIIDGATGRLENDLLHEDQKPLREWLLKHERYAAGEAAELFRKRREDLEAQIDATLFGTQAQRVRWLRHKVWDRLPPLARPFAYFGYRAFLRGGALDGKEAFVYHFLQSLWFPMLIDAYYLDLKRKAAHEARE